VPAVRAVKPSVTLLALALAATISGCAVAQPSAQPEGVISVVATTSVLADLVANVGGAHVTVSALVPKGSDVHTFDPRPSDAVTLAGADLIVMNGLGLDDWLEPLAQNAGRPNLPILKLAENLPGVDYITSDGAEGGAYNPHLWLDVAYAREYVERIRAQLVEIDPDHQADYLASAAGYDLTLADLDAYVSDQLAQIPADARRLVAFHDAFPYFARAYDVQVVGVVVAAPGQDPSAGEIASLVEAIRASRVKLILAEVQFPDQLVQQLAADTGATVESDLYTDTLGDRPLDSYAAMMRWDADRIVAGLR
jgi:ABC-type Zn uptake system ZnuABC Zn-binding protein ZnuA